MTADVVVVSPHLDDAVLSAAAQLMRPGARVVTVFAGVPPEGTPPAEWDVLTGADDAAQRVRERLVEDDRALAALGVEDTTRLGFPDGQHVADDRDRTPQADLVRALQPHLAGAAEVWLPAAVGSHPDHVAARDGALLAAPAGAVVHHYADLPYSLVAGWPRPGVDAWAVGCASADRPLVRTVHQLDPGARHRKVAAMACYATQLGALELERAVDDEDPMVVGIEVSWSRS